MGSRLKKIKNALTKSIGGQTYDPEVKANFEAGKREGMLKAARAAGRAQGKRIGSNMGKSKFGSLGNVSDMLSNAGSKANNVLDFMDTDYFGPETPNSVPKAKKRISKSSKKATTIRINGQKITITGQKKKKKRQPATHEPEEFNPLDW